MRFVSTLLSASLLLAGAFAATKTPSQRFDEFHGLTKSSNPVKLSETKYKSLTTAPRDYSAVVLLTALETRFGCKLCREFQPEYDLLAKSWLKGDKKAESRLIFSSLDFVDGRDVFVSLGLQTAPVLLLFPPTEGPHAAASPEPARFDFTTGAPTAEYVQNWIAKQMPGRPHPQVKRPVNYVKYATVSTIVLGVFTALFAAWPYVHPILTHRKLWAVFSLFLILMTTSGHMFNFIRKVPYVAGDGKGGVMYFAASFQSQYGIESQVIAGLYGVLSFCAITLAHKVAHITDARQQQIQVLAWSAFMFVIYGFLLSIFRIKNGGYPFSLPPFM